MKKLFTAMRDFFREEEGASLVEYGLLVALIALAVIIILYQVGQAINNAFARICFRINNDTACTF